MTATFHTKSVNSTGSSKRLGLSRSVSRRVSVNYKMKMQVTPAKSYLVCSTTKTAMPKKNIQVSSRPQNCFLLLTTKVKQRDSSKKQKLCSLISLRKTAMQLRKSNKRKKQLINVLKATSRATSLKRPLTNSNPALQTKRICQNRVFRQTWVPQKDVP